MNFSEYEDTTDSINQIVTTQLLVPTWNNIPGGLQKTSSSAGGYIWGFNASNSLYRCALPCSGNWELIDLSKFNTQILDLATDNTNVYVLTSAGLLISANTTQFSLIDVPGTPTSIFSTHTYIWTQDGTTKQKCAKPCTTGSWISEKDTTGKIMSSTDTELFGVDANGQGLKSDETLQTGWTQIAGLAGKQLKLLSGMENVLFGVE
jgi:hypothetical protein